MRPYNAAAKKNCNLNGMNFILAGYGCLSGENNNDYYESCGAIKQRDNHNQYASYTTDLLKIFILMRQAGVFRNLFQGLKRLFIKINKIEKNEMGWACGAYG